MRIESKNISKKSLFVLLLFGFGLGSLLLWLLFSVLSSFAEGSIGFTIDTASGLAGFIETLVIWPFFAVIWVGLTWLFLLLGFAILNRFTTITLLIKDAGQSNE